VLKEAIALVAGNKKHPAQALAASELRKKSFLFMGSDYLVYAKETILLQFTLREKGE
jgi:hypothetical protein